MERQAFDPRLSQMSTQWTLVFQSHSGLPEEAHAAQVALVDRYSGAILSYLLGAVRDPELASDLSQEFLVRFIRGDFHRADPSRGRFRDFVKRSLRNLMINHIKSRKRGPRPLEGAPEPSLEAFETDFDARFTESWRRELLDRAWRALETLQAETGQPYHTVLRCRVENPELRSPALAERLSAQLGRPLTANGVRQALLRSRDRFVRFLLDEVTASLENPTDDDIDRELVDLHLIDYCRDYLKRHRAAD